MKRFEKYIKMIEQDFPAFIISSIKKIGEGDNSKAFLINDEFIFRFPKREKVKEQVRREICVLPLIKQDVNIKVPSFKFISTQINYVGYEMIKGEFFCKKTFDILKEKEQKNIQKTLADFLSSLHRIEFSRLKDCSLEKMDHKAEYQENLEKAKRLIYPHLSSKKREIINHFFTEYLGNSDNFNHVECLIHNDFSKDHILLDGVSKQISGIIDFGDIAMGDPDYDLMYLLDEFGEDFMNDFLKYYHTGNKFIIQKLRFFTLANKIQLFPDNEEDNDSNDWKYAMSLLNKWFDKYAVY